MYVGMSWLPALNLVIAQVGLYDLWDVSIGIILVYIKCIYMT